MDHLRALVYSFLRQIPLFTVILFAVCWYGDIMSLKNTTHPSQFKEPENFVPVVGEHQNECPNSLCSYTIHFSRYHHFVFCATPIPK